MHIFHSRQQQLLLQSYRKCFCASKQNKVKYNSNVSKFSALLLCKWCIAKRHSFHARKYFAGLCTIVQASLIAKYYSIKCCSSAQSHVSLDVTYAISRLFIHRIIIELKSIELTTTRPYVCPKWDLQQYEIATCTKVWWNIIKYTLQVNVQTKNRFSLIKISKPQNAFHLTCKTCLKWTAKDLQMLISFLLLFKSFLFCPSQFIDTNDNGQNDDLSNNAQERPQWGQAV